MNQDSDILTAQALTAQALAVELAALLNRIMDAGYWISMGEDSDAVTLYDPANRRSPAGVYLPYEGERRWTA